MLQKSLVLGVLCQKSLESFCFDKKKLFLAEIANHVHKRKGNLPLPLKKVFAIERKIYFRAERLLWLALSTSSSH